MVWAGSAVKAAAANTRMSSTFSPVNRFWNQLPHVMLVAWMAEVRTTMPAARWVVGRLVKTAEV